MSEQESRKENHVINLSVYGETENCCHIKLKMTVDGSCVLRV
jgi:hypothetical protein